MSKETLHASIQAAISALGPSVIPEQIDLGNGPTTYYFRRLPFIEMDRLRLHALNAEGKFDKTLHVGSNARLVAATLCDEVGEPFTSDAAVADWPTPIVEKLSAAAQRVNGIGEVNKEEIAKKSETTPAAV